MKMIGVFKHDVRIDNEFEEKKVQRDLALIEENLKSLLKNKLDNIIDTEEKLKPIFCERVDGFIPSSWNKGGYELSGFVLSLETALIHCNNELAKEKISEIDNDSEEAVTQEFMRQHKFETIAELNEALSNNEELQEEFNDDMNSYRDDEAVRFSLRVMYNGYSEEGYTFTVDSKINWEMPYFRDGKGSSAYSSTEFSIKNPSEFSSTCDSEIKRVMELFKKN